MDIPQSWQEIAAMAERGVTSLGQLPLPGLEVMDGLVLISVVLLLTVILFLLRQRYRLRQAEQARNNAEALASSLFDALPDAAVITDPEGRCLSVNPAFARLVGRAEREITGARLSDLFTPAVAEHFHYRPVENEDDELPESFRIRADHATRFIAHKIPLFDTQGLLVAVLTQLRPADQAASLAQATRPESGRNKQASPAVRTTSVSMDIGLNSDEEVSNSAASPPEIASNSEKDGPHQPRIAPLSPKEEREESTAERQPSSGLRPTGDPVSAPPPPEPGLTDALQIAFRVSGDGEENPKPSPARSGVPSRPNASWSPIAGIEVVENVMEEELAEIFQPAGGKKS